MGKYSKNARDSSREATLLAVFSIATFLASKNSASNNIVGEKNLRVAVAARPSDASYALSRQSKPLRSAKSRAEAMIPG